MQAIFSFIKGFFGGFMVGGGLGLLLAPRPGIETQRRLEEEFAASKEVKREVEEETN